MSQFNLRYVPTLSCDQFILNGQQFTTQAANIPNGNGVITATPALTTQVIINDATKNQALYAEIVGNIHGNVFPVLQAEINALEANVAILQGNVIALEAEDVNLQNQILLLSGNVVINANAIAELINDTQFLEAPYYGLGGNTSFFWRGLQVYNTATDTINETTDTGIFSYLDGNVATGNQIQLRVQDSRNVFIKGSTTINTPSNGLVSIGGTGNTAMTFSVGNSTNNAQINMNGNINLLGDGSSKVSVYTSSTLIPIPSTTKKVDIRGDDEANIFGKKITVKNDSNASLTLEGNIATISTVSQTLITSSGTVNVVGDTTNVYSTNLTTISAPNGKIIDINCGTGGTNSEINIGTYQQALQTGYQKISIGYQPTVPLSTAKTSTWIYGDFYRPYPILPVPTSVLLLYDQLMYVGTPTAYSGGLNGPVGTTVNPYFRSISTYCPDSTVNSFVQMSGVFTITVVAGAIVNTCGAGGYSLNVGGGLLAMTSMIGGVAVTCGAGAIQLTTGAGQIGMTTGAAPIVAETLYGDILLKAGYSSTSTPQTALGSIYLKARNYTYITPDLSVVVGSGVEAPFNSTIVDTITGNAFFGNLFTIANCVYSNVFLTPNITSSIVNPLYANLFYQGNIVDQTGLAQASIFYPNGALSNLSEVAIVPYKGNLAGNVIQGNIELTKFTFQYLPLPLNANVYIKIQPVLNDPTQPNLLLSRFGYGTLQSNAQIQSNIGVLLNGYLEPAPPVYDKYLTVLGNASIQQDLECNANVIVIKDAFPLLNTTLTNNSVFTTGNVTCTTLNYTFLNPPIVIPNIGSGGVDSIIAGTNVSISPLNGLGNVIINCTLPNVAGVNSIIAGNGIDISPIGGQGNVTVSLAGSVIPPGGYLPINGGTMTGSIYQFPSSNIFNNTVQKYRPMSSYQPPYPSIGPPSFTGELLTFFNGDNPPVQDGFTGWFSQNLIDKQPTFITEPINIDTTTKFYQTVGGTSSSTTFVVAAINNFKVGDHLTGGYFPYAAFDSGLIGGPFFQIVNVLNGKQVVLYRVNIAISDGGPSSTNLPEVDFTYTTGQQTGGQNYAYIYSSIDQSQGNPSIDCNNLNGNWEGYLNLAINKTSSFMAIDNILYEYFNDTNTIQKLIVVNGTGMGQPPKILGITTKQVATTNLIYIYGIFQTANVLGTTDVEVNNIFQYNVNTNVLVRLTATTASANAFGVNNAVYGVDVSNILNNSVFFWGDFTGSGAQGGVVPGDTNINCGFSWTGSNIWTSTQVFGVTPIGTEIGGCRGGIIVQDYLGSPNTTALLIYAQTYNVTQPLNTITSAVVTYGAAQFIGSSGWPFGNPPPSTGAIISGTISKMQIVSGRVIFMGAYIGSAWDGSNYVNSYSISSCLTNGTFSNSIYFGANYEIYAGSNNAGFWIVGADQITVNTVQLQSNNTLIIGTNGYRVAPNGGGVMVYTLSGGLAALPIKQPILATLPYSVNSIIGNTASAVQLTCSLNINNFFFSQTFNSTNPLVPATTPTVNAINGAKFAVASTEMDKIVFSGSDTDFASVSFIAGDVEDGDKIWYWSAQVGLIDYYDGATFYPNISPVGVTSTPNIAQVLAVGNNALAQNLTNLGSISSASATIIYASTPSLDATTIGDILSTGLFINPDGNLRIKGAITKGSLLAGDGTNTIEFPTTSNNLYLKTNSSTSSGLEWVSINGVASITPGFNIGIDNTIPNAPIVSLLNPLTSNLNLGTQFVSGSSGYINFTAAATSEAQMSALLGFISYDCFTPSIITSLYKSGLTTSTSSDTLVVAPTSITKSFGATTLGITSTSSSITITPLAANDCNVIVSGAGKLHAIQSSTGGSTQPICRFENTNGGANGVHIDFYKNSTSPANNDEIGGLSFHANNGVATSVEYARIGVTQRDITSASENGSLSLYVCENSPTPTEYFRSNGILGSNDLYKPIDTRGNAIKNTVAGQSLTLTQTVASSISINNTGGGSISMSCPSNQFVVTSNQFYLYASSGGALTCANDLTFITGNNVFVNQSATTNPKLRTDIANVNYHPEFIVDNANSNVVSIPPAQVYGEKLILVNKGVSPIIQWNAYGNAQGSVGVNAMISCSNGEVYVARADSDTINIYDSALTSVLGSFTVGGQGNRRVYCFYEESGFLFIGGSFTSVNSNATPQINISRINISTRVEDPLEGSGYVGFGGNGVGRVNTLTGYLGELIVGGEFTEIYGNSIPALACNYLGRVVNQTASSGSQNFYEVCGGTNNIVYAVNNTNGYLFVGGSFTYVYNNLENYEYLAYLNGNTGTWSYVGISNYTFNFTVTTIMNTAFYPYLFIGGNFSAPFTYGCYIDWSNPNSTNATSSGRSWNNPFYNNSQGFYNGNSYILTPDEVTHNTAYQTWVSLGTPPTVYNPSYIGSFAGELKVAYENNPIVYSKTVFSQSCIFTLSTGNFKYNGTLYTSYTLALLDVAMEFLGDTTSSPAYWRPIGYAYTGGSFS